MLFRSDLSFTSIKKWACGFVHSTLVTVPVRSIFLLESNTAAPEWWAYPLKANINSPTAENNMTNFARIVRKVFPSGASAAVVFAHRAPGALA